MKFDNCKYDHIQLADQFLKMAEKFMPYAANPKNEVAMMQAEIEVHPCGTIACHGGFAALALCVDSNWFEDGADELAKFLGFCAHDELELWANFHDDIWGNFKGGEMFSNREAFDGKWDDSFGLHTIVSHYLSVAKRLMEIKE